MNKSLPKLLVLLLAFLLPGYGAYASIDSKMFKEKCDQGDFLICNKLGRYYAYDPNDNLDFNAASIYYGKACKLGKIKEACEALVFARGSNSSIKSYRVPDEVQRSVNIFNYYKKETNYENLYAVFNTYCYKQKDPRACAFCGEMKIMGLGTKANIKQGITLLKQTCKDGDIYACSNLGFRYFAANKVDNDEFKAFNLLNYACDNGEFAACRYVAAFYENEIGVAYDKDKIEHLYTLSCNNDDAVSCHKLGLFYFNSNDESQKLKANDCLTKGCNYGSVRACSFLGDLYSAGSNGLNKDEKKAYELYRRACDGSDANGCYNLAEYYNSGKGISKSRNIAATILVKACELGSIKACDKLEKKRKHNERAQEAVANEVYPNLQ